MGRGWINSIKELNAAKKGKVFTKIAREITVAAKLGGADSEANPRLRMALKDARENSMPKDTVDRAIRRATGEGSEAQYEENIYEGYGPHGVAMLVETLTDNKNRTVQDLRAMFVRGGGNLGEPGSVMWMFERIGSVIASSTQKIDPEDAAIEAGANEVETLEDGQFQFITNPSDVDTVQSTLATMGWKILKYELSYKCKNPIELSNEQEEELKILVDKLDDHDDVKKIHL